MAADPSQVIVTKPGDAYPVRLHHSDIPELQADGESIQEAAANLAQELTSQLRDVADEMHRAPLERALADVRAFIEKGS